MPSRLSPAAAVSSAASALAAAAPAAAALIATALTATVLLAGCSGPVVPPLQEEGPSAGPPASEAAAVIDPMTVDTKRSLIASSFPIEVPVPDGRVERGQAQGEDAWDYVVVVDVPIATLADWYSAAYVGRNWQLVEGGEADDAASSQTLVFRKGAAESRVDLVAEGEVTRASVVLGVGTPVLQTQ